MKDLTELWVGDKLKMVNSSHLVTFEGIDPNGNAWVRLDDQKQSVPKEFLELIEEELDDPRITSSFSISEDEDVSNNTIPQGSQVIDLHIDKLSPDMVTALPERILAFQLEKAKQFIGKMIDNHIVHFEIIHGKGSGVLKLEIEHLTSMYREIGFTFERNNGGSMEIWLRYN